VCGDPRLREPTCGETVAALGRRRKIVKAAEKTIDEQAKAPNSGNLSKAPYNDKNSPTKLIVSGVPEFPKHNMKNNKENSGII
jgi:hypothetical protein